MSRDRIKNVLNLLREARVHISKSEVDVIEKIDCAIDKLEKLLIENASCKDMKFMCALVLHDIINQLPSVIRFIQSFHS